MAPCNSKPGATSNPPKWFTSPLLEVRTIKAIAIWGKNPEAMQLLETQYLPDFSILPTKKFWLQKR